MAATVTTALISRLANSTQAWNWSGAATSCAVQFGQSGQPRPEPVRRTAAPDTMVRTRVHTEAAAMVWKARGETRQARRSSQGPRRGVGPGTGLPATCLPPPRARPIRTLLRAVHGGPGASPQRAAAAVCRPQAWGSGNAARSPGPRQPALLGRAVLP